MIEDRILDLLDLGDSVQKLDLYERPKLLKFFHHQYLLIKHGINFETFDMICHIIYFMQLINLSAININEEGDLILGVVKYFEKIILPVKSITSENNLFLIYSIVNYSISSIHFILSLVCLKLLYKKATINMFYFIISFINYIYFYYLIGPIVFIALNGTKCDNNIHEFLGKKCYSDGLHLSTLILNFFFAIYILINVEFFALYNNQIDSLHEIDIQTRTRINCDYDIYNCNMKIIIFIVSYFYVKYYINSNIYKYIYNCFYVISCFILAIYSLKQVYYYNKKINNIIHFGWCFVTWFSLCMVLKEAFTIHDTTIFIVLGWIIITIVLIYFFQYSYYKRVTQINLFADQSLIYVKKFIITLLDLYHSTKKEHQLLLLGVIRKLENYISSNPELNNIYKNLINDSYMKKKYYAMNQIQVLSLIYIIYVFHFEKSDIRNDIILSMCYFLINHIKNPTYAIFLLTKLKSNNHSQLYHEYVLIQDIKLSLMNKLTKKNYGKSLNHIQIGSVILYYHYMDVFKIKIYDAITHQIEYFDILRNNITNGKVTDNFLKTGEEILTLKQDIFQIWKLIVDLNPFCDESENDFMLYLKSILQDEILAKNEEKKFNLLKASKFAEKNSLYYSLFKHDINSVILVDGNRVLYATPNFPLLYQFNGKDIINSLIDEFMPNMVLNFHKDLMENALKYSNITRVFHKNKDTFLKGKNNLLYYVNFYIKPIPNMTYGLLYIALITKIKDHEFIITLDSNFKIDGFTEMHQGNSFTINNTQNNSYYLNNNFINRHVGLIIPEILLHLRYKDNMFTVNNNLDVKGNLYSLGSLRDLEPKLNILLEIIKKKGFLNIDEDTDEGGKNLFEYNNYKKSIIAKHSKSYSIFFKVTTIKFLEGKYRYHRLNIRNDTLSLNENEFLSPTTYISGSEDFENKKRDKHPNKTNTFGTDRGTIKTEENAQNKNENKENKKRIKLKVNFPREIKKITNDKNQNNLNLNTKDKLEKTNDLKNVNTLKNQVYFDSAGFNKLKNGIVNKKDSIQIIIMKWVCLLYVIVTIILVIYEHYVTNDLFVDLIQYLKENLYFIHSKIITANIYINSINLKWRKYEYIDENSCLLNCSHFYMTLLQECIVNLKEGKDSLNRFDIDFQDIILKRRNISVSIFNTNETNILNIDVNDYLNFIISKGIKFSGNFLSYMDYSGNQKINMENLIRQSYTYFQSGVASYTGQTKMTKVESKFKNDYITIILGIIFCVILLIIFTYFIFQFIQLEIFFLDKLINFNSPNFEAYLKNLEDLKKKLKNYKNEEEEENNLDEMEMEGKSQDNSDQNNSKNQNKSKNKKKNAIKEEDEKKKAINNNKHKKGSKQNKIQLQRMRKKKVMSYFFYKENIFFAVKVSFILICFVSYFIVSYIVYKACYENYIDFDQTTNDVEELYYQSFKTFLEFKSQLADFQTDNNYVIILPDGKDLQIPNFGNSLNELSPNSIYSEKNKNILNQLYKGDMCSLLFNSTTEYDYCKAFLSSILLKGMEQAIIQMGVLINSVIDEISLVKDNNTFTQLVYENKSNFKKYELFVEYYLLKAYLQNEKIFNGFRQDHKDYYLKLSLYIIIIYFIGYLFLFILLLYFIFKYKYIYTSLFNFCAILSVKTILDDEFFYQKIVELEKKLYN